MRFSIMQANSATDVRMPSVWTGRDTSTWRIRRPNTSAMLALVMLVICGTHAIAVYGDPRIANPIGYLCYSLTLWMCMAACLVFGHRERGTIRVRWMLLATAQGAAGVYFIFNPLQWAHWLRWSTGQTVGVSFNALNHSLLLLGATLWFAGASRRMAVLDGVQALLAAVLQFFVIFAPRTHDLFTVNHLAVATGIKIFLFLTALTALAGAGFAAERRFLKLLTLFLGLQAVASFLMNQVAYVWLHHKLASIWDVPETFFNLAFVLVAVNAMDRSAAKVSDIQPTLFVRNLMPSFLALGNIGLGLLLLSRYQAAGVGAILLAVACYMLRTTLLQGQAAKERNSLHRLNQQLSELAAQDTLTGAGNRRSLAAALDHLTASQEHETLALILIDTDKFKQANDRFGHLYGDEVLIAIAEVLISASGACSQQAIARASEAMNSHSCFRITMRPQRASSPIPSGFA